MKNYNVTYPRGTIYVMSLIRKNSNLSFKMTIFFKNILYYDFHTCQSNFSILLEVPPKNNSSMRLLLPTKISVLPKSWLLGEMWVTAFIVLMTNNSMNDISFSYFTVFYHVNSYRCLLKHRQCACRMQRKRTILLDCWD